MMMYEYILLQYNDDKKRTERKYGIIAATDDSEALSNLGKWYDILRIEYFSCVSEDEDDCVYELNDDWANDFKYSGRRFKKIIPELNDLPSNDNIEE